MTQTRLGKLFTEVVGNADGRLAEGVRACGDGRMEAIGFGILPQVPSSYASYAPLRFGIDVREAARSWC